MEFKQLKKALDHFNIHEAAELLMKIYINDPLNFRKSLLLSNSLPEPINKEIKSEQLEVLTKAFIFAGKELITKNIDILVFCEEYFQIISSIEVLNQNVTSNLQLLDKNSFSNYTLSQQLQMVCIYIEDQNRLLNEQDQNELITGMERQVAKYEADDVKEVRVSQADSTEALLEITDTLFRYLYFQSKDSEMEVEFEHEDISPYGIGSLQGIMSLALQRNLLVNIWSKFKYREWNLRKVENGDRKINLFEPPFKEDYLKERLAIDRYIYREHINLQQINIKYKKENKKSAESLYSVAKDLEDPENVFNLDKKSFNRSKIIVENVIAAQLKSLNDIYFDIEYKGLKVTDLLKGIEYLFTIGMIYQKSTRNVFIEQDTSTYKKLAPIIDKRILVNQFSYLYDLDYDTAELIMNTFVFCETYKLDVFSQPLIPVNDTKLVFTPTLITQMNIVRVIEMLTTEWKTRVSDKGSNFERELRFILSFNPHIEVNTNKMEFVAYDGRDVEFDFLARFEDQILLIEFKHLKIPYSDKMLRNALSTIDVGIKQVNRRENVIKNDWDKVRKSCSFNLPNTPPQKENIIKLVCTNILDFTSVVRYGIEIIDASSLIKFFMSPEVKLYSNGVEVNGSPYKNLWEKGAPSVKEFRSFLENPIAIQPLKGCYEGLYKPISKSDIEDKDISFFDYSLVKDPYQELASILDQQSVTYSRNKIGRNETCPCGSGKKHKKCCNK